MSLKLTLVFFLSFQSSRPLLSTQMDYAKIGLCIASTATAVAVAVQPPASVMLTLFIAFQGGIACIDAARHLRKRGTSTVKPLEDSQRGGLVSTIDRSLTKPR